MNQESEGYVQDVHEEEERVRQLRSLSATFNILTSLAIVESAYILYLAHGLGYDHIFVSLSFAALGAGIYSGHRSYMASKEIRGLEQKISENDPKRSKKT